jgi:GntR family transcriptional regulator
MSEGEEASRHAVRARLRELIAAARPGDRLPSERDLSRRWRAARMTVRSAMDALVAEGLVARRHGSGTYVLSPPVVRFLGLTSFTQDMRDRGLVASSLLLAFDTIPADPDTAARLRIPVGASVHRFTRLRSGGGEPMAVETVTIATALVPDLAPGDLDGSLYELLATRYRLGPSSADVTIEPILPDPSTRRALAIPDDQACLHLRMTDLDHRGRVLMVADCTYRGDRYQLSAHLPSGVSASAVTSPVMTQQSLLTGAAAR